MDKNSNLECNDCRDVVAMCSYCEKDLKHGKVLYCVTCEDENGSQYQEHYCSQKCTVKGMAVQTEVI